MKNPAHDPEVPSSNPGKNNISDFSIRDPLSPSVYQGVIVQGLPGNVAEWLGW